MGNTVSGQVSIADGAFQASVRIPIPVSLPISLQFNAHSKTSRPLVSMRDPTSTSTSTSTPRRLLKTLAGTLKTSLCYWLDNTLECVCGASNVLSDIDESWLDDMMADFDTAIEPRTTRKQQTPAIEAGSIESDTSCEFVTPENTLVKDVTSINEWMVSRSDSKVVDADCVSCTTEATDLSSESDSDDLPTFYCKIHSDCHCESEYYSDDDDVETKADRLLRLASCNCDVDECCVYVEDYLCPCGECPAYKRIEDDVHQSVTWCNSTQQQQIIRVLQALSTYNEVVGYQQEMICAADECLQMWLGDEDQAFKSMVLLFDQVPELCAGFA